MTQKDSFFLVILTALSLSAHDQSSTPSESLKQFFTSEYNKVIQGVWGVVESASGPGSTMAQTHMVRLFLSHTITNLSINSIVDGPCGDCRWITAVLENHPECLYYGIDIVEPLIQKNRLSHGSSKRLFLCQDLVNDPLPQVDLILSRDFLVHLSNNDIFKAIAQFKKSGSKYLLTTTFPHRKNHDINSGGWRPLNLQEAPFNFPNPLIIISENCTEQNGLYADKSLALWILDDLAC